MNWITDNLGVSPAARGKILASVVAVVVLLLGRAIALRAIHRRFAEAWVGYRARKAATYAVTVLGIVILAWIWIDAFNHLPAYLGLVSAGVAIALLSRRPLRVGDRIEIKPAEGEVADIRLFRFSIMEVGNGVEADRATGRLIHIPNGLLFTHLAYPTVRTYLHGPISLAQSQPKPGVAAEPRKGRAP